MKLQSYKELVVWQKAVRLATEVYGATEAYPKSELYGLAAHTRRTAVSIPSNVAEGSTRQHLPEYLQFLNVALGSAAELETQLIIARELKFVAVMDFEELIGLLTEVAKMLNALMRRLRPNT